MRRLHGPSLFLGMGLGMMLVALLGAVFFSTGTREMSDEEILTRASALGMRMPEPSDGVVRQPDGVWMLVLEEETTLAVLVDKLQASGVLENVLEFEILARQGQVPDPLPPGRYAFPADCSAREVAALLSDGPVESP